ncbi:MAG: AMP-dependent synthetase/ligase [Planctomycetota bacterium]
MNTVNGFLFQACERYADRTMQVWRDREWTFTDAARAAHGVALALSRHGVRPGDRVALIAENSPRWCHVYLGILAAGGVVVPRGIDIGDDELRYILAHSKSEVVFAQNEAVAARIPAGIETIRLDAEDFPPAADLEPGTLQRYASLRRPEDLVVILYTSGTTGRPKGVMLEQRNIAHNIRTLPSLVGMEAGDVWVSVLPSWHTFEQTVELCGFAAGCITIYSDKRRLRDDLRRHRPHFFASVPRIWETIYRNARETIEKRGRATRTLFRLACAGSSLWRRGNPLGLPLHALGKLLFYRKIRAATGGRLKVAVSGGGYIPLHVDEFFLNAGIKLLVGYGLTETAPVVALRDASDNVLGTIGRAVPETEIRIGPERTIQVRGPQVMRGYYQDEALTGTVLDADGWFDTGDLAEMTEKGDLVFIGRAKETIVLSGGENIEPEPIESSVLRSPYVHQVMLVGQDRKTLAALIVPEPDPRPTEDRIREELRLRTGVNGGFRSFEAVHRFALLDEPFTVETGLLTQTLKMRRNVIAERYAETIASLYG